ncbi:MAG: hypothetical protein KDD43_02020, partial [Bdellovibrionales bacterium]|nr:hypothetical protein [Bdellovibrionales bacterium]
MRAHLCLIFLMTFVWTIEAYSQVLKIQGASQPVVDSVRKKYPHLFDKNSSLAEVDEIVRQLMSAGSFEKITAYQQSNGNILIDVQTLRRISGVQVRGHSIASAATIKDLLALKPSDRFERKAVMEAGERLKEFYGERGFYNTVVEVKFINTGESQVEILFEIEEREPCRIFGIEFVSPNKGLNDRLAKKLKKFYKDPLTTAMFQDIQKAIEEVLKKDRYLQASLGTPEISYNTDRTEARLKYTVKEPFRYDHYFYGSDQLSVFDLFRAINLDEMTLSSGDPVIEVTDKV